MTYEDTRSFMGDGDSRNSGVPVKAGSLIHAGFIALVLGTAQ